MNQALKYYSLVLDTLCVTYDLNNYAWPANYRCVRYRKWCQRFLWHQLAL